MGEKQELHQFAQKVVNGYNIGMKAHNSLSIAHNELLRSIVQKAQDYLAKCERFGMSSADASEASDLRKEACRKPEAQKD